MEEVQDIFLIACNDPHHRVAVNALLGLYYQKEATALDSLHSLAAHSSREFRAAAMWGIRLIKDPKSIPALQELAKNGLDGVVRQKANLLLAELVPAAAEAEPSKIKELVQPVEAPQTAEPKPEIQAGVQLPAV
jgi:HEAT repeat protein